ncbi:MAG: hypothetical protein IT430_17750 [Phycisphaerales bacterium]|nr:hypothetical protein [Phycisphaerales bacterium]
MAYDGARGLSVIFGGGTRGAYQNDTWGWDGVDWMQLDALGPPERSSHALAYDEARELVVLFGGYNGEISLRDTWEWNGQYWSGRANSGPDRRHNHAMAYDSLRGVTVLFGGNVGGTPQNDTWEWDGTTWTKVSEGGPPPRRNHAMAYDRDRGVVVVFGGVGTDYPTIRADMWEWDGHTWKNVVDAGNPGARYDHAMCYDTRRGAIVLFGGRSPSGHLGDTWELACERRLRLLPPVGACPGPMKARITGATPHGRVAVVFGTRDRHTRIPGGPCPGVILPLAGTIRLVGTPTADSEGVVDLTGIVPVEACGGRLAAVDVTTCEVSNPIIIE